MEVPRSFRRSDQVVTRLTPPRLSSLPQERGQLEFSSRSMVFRNDGEEIRRIWGAPDDPFPVAVAPDGARWKVTVWGRTAAEGRDAVRAMFCLDHPVEEFYRQVRREPALRGTERRYRGLRLPRDASLYEAIVHSILGQQLSVAAASTMKRRLLERTGAFVNVEGDLLPRVPSPHELSSLGPDGLRGIGVSGAKARALLALAERWSSGALVPDGLDTMSVEQAIERLDAEPGVGRWTAENALLRGIGRRDLFVAGDLGLRVALERFGVLPRNASEEDAREWGDRWYPGWGSYATLYLWRRLVEEITEERAARAAAGPRSGASGRRPRARST